MHADKMEFKVLLGTSRETLKMPNTIGMIIPISPSVFIRVHPWFEFHSSLPYLIGA
jgi:hypothetical protein